MGRILASLDEEYMIPIHVLDDIMAKRDEQHGFGEPSKVEEADTSDSTSASIDISTSESIDIGISETIDTYFCHRSIPLEIPERSTCPQDITDSTHKSTDVLNCSPSPDVEKEITMEDFLELEEFLELEDGEKLGDLDSSRAVTMEDFLELEEWLEDMDHNSKKKLDDDQHTSRGDLETSPKASIDRHQPDEINRQPPHIIDQRPPNIIDRQSTVSIGLHPHSIIDQHPPDCIDRHPWLDELPGYIVELEQTEERVHESKASRNADSKHLRPLICAEKAAGFHKRVKRIHNPHVEASQRGLRFRDEVDKDPAEAASIDIDQIPSNDINKPASIDATTSPSIDTGRVSKPNKFDVCGNLRDGDTTTRSEKSGERRGGIGRREKGSRTVLRCH
ncbi:hypothetical protein F2Q69_00007067 [Brassica cretica]|uniref:Uncharacterized protein n=1 Tax=Brassica cretica TaxID=69181 RepID=A0A8S9PDV1_BRACR|nr:hypothetical protein F2Q69_00007067 [Brassica cretica]